MNNLALGFLGLTLSLLAVAAFGFWAGYKCGISVQRERQQSGDIQGE